MNETPHTHRLLATILTLVSVLAWGVFARPAAAQVDVNRPAMITPKTEASIAKGLAYLARVQGRDGSWRSSGGYGGGGYPVAMTSLAGMAMMSAGNTQVEGPYAINVRKAIDFLLSSVQRNGLIARQSESSRPMHGHGFAIMFLAQAYGMEPDPTRQAKIKRALRRAIDLTGKSQSGPGGWLYTPDSGGDEGSVTVTQIQGLRAARNAGVHVPKSIIDKATNYIKISANPDGGIRYRAGSPGTSRPAITAAAVATMYNAGEYENPIALKSLEYLKKHLKGKSGARTFGGHQYYATLYAGQAMYLSSEENWKSYFPHTRDWLIGAQASDGSWQGDGVGTTYGTAIALMTLQLPYKNLPLLQR